MTLGSLFDGIGGFPLAASRYGIETKWAEYIMQGISAVYGDIKEADHTNVACLLG